MSSQFREPARLNEPLNGEEIKKMLLKTLEKALEADGNLRQHVVYPFFGINYRFEFFTGGSGPYDKKDWKAEGDAKWIVKGTEVADIVPEGISKRSIEGEIRVDGVETPADLVREQTGLTVPIPVVSPTGYVQYPLEDPRPKPTRSAAEEIADLVAATAAEPIETQKAPPVASKLSGAAATKSKGLTPEQRMQKIKDLQNG